jgi:2-polyprenyl-3-methyl-5-hydroxy-6-metoxy-1,4-benzoquinol methylase
VSEPSLSIVGGQPLTPDAIARLSAHGVVRLMIDRPALAPLDVGDIVEVVLGAAPRVGHIVLCSYAGRYELGRLVGRRDTRLALVIGPRNERASLPADAIAGVATALEQGDILLDLRHGRWHIANRIAAKLPRRLVGLLSLLAWLERLRRPFFPPLCMGSDERLLAQLAAAYDVEADVVARESALLPEEETLLRRYLAPGRRLLDVGCGAGREAIGFARAGVEVVGIDIAPAMVTRARETARKAGLAIEFEVGEPLTWPASGALFHVIYFSPGIYSHIPGRARRVQTLAHLRTLLAPGGLIVVEPVLAPPRLVLSRARVVDIVRSVGRRLGVKRLGEPGDQLYRGHGLVRAPISHRFVHRFRDHAEAEAELADAGLVVSDRIDHAYWVVRPRT